MGWILLGLVFALLILYLSSKIPAQPIGNQRMREEPPPLSYSGLERTAVRSGITPPEPRSRRGQQEPQYSVPTARNSDLEWAEPGKPFKFGNYTIPNGAVYWSRSTPLIAEASCIDLSLPVWRPVEEPKGSLGYWPQYARMTPSQRANYLEWLAGGRKAPLNDIGYAFVFFYGLERRVLLDGADLELALRETLRLLNTYTGSRSFFSYLSSFVAYVVARKGVAKLPTQWFQWIFLDALPGLNEDNLAVALAWVCAHNCPLPLKLAYEVAKQDVRCPNSVVIKRAGERFFELFKKKYVAQFGEGMRIRPAAAGKDRIIEYRTATPSLLGRLDRVRLANPLGVQSQFKPLVQIWTDCVEELKPLSRQLAKGQRTMTREIFKALPAALKAEVEHPDKHVWDAMVVKHAREDGFVFVTAGDLAKMQDIPQRPKLTLKQSLDLAETARDVGFALVPDPRILRRSYDWGEKVAVQRMEYEREAAEESNFTAAAFMLEIGMAMAAADGKVDREEVIHVSLGLKSQFKLNRDDARRLEAYREILIRKPPTLRNFSGFVQTAFGPEQREALGQFLVGVAAVDGVIEKAERKALENAYKAFGVPVAKLRALLHEIESQSEEPVVVQEHHPVVPGEAIPLREDRVPEQRVKLNRDVINRILGETAAVAEMLGRAMGDMEDLVQEVEQATEQDEIVANPVADTIEANVFEGLDARYHSALSELITQREWSRVEFDALARRNGLMPAAMLEVINSWTDERYGDFLIEEGDPYVIQVELLEAA